MKINQMSTILKKLMLMQMTYNKMKKRFLFEQQDATNVSVVSAPKDELQYLNNDVLKSKGQLLNLKLDDAGNPEQVRVNDKTYTAAILTEKGNYLLYDGRVLVKNRTTGEFEYMYKDGKLVRIQGIPPSNLSKNYEGKLETLGLLGKTNLYSLLDQSVSKLQSLINKGYLGDVFRDFNDLLGYYYSTDKTKRLKPKEGSPRFEPDIDQDVMSSQYKPIQLDRYGMKGVVYKPNESTSTDLAGKTITKNETTCKTTLAKYIGLAAQSKGMGKSMLNDNQISNYIDTIRSCRASGSFDNVKLTQDDFATINIQKKYVPFGFLNKRLTYDEVVKYIKNNIADTPDLEKWLLPENRRNLKSTIHNILLETYSRKYHRK